MCLMLFFIAFGEGLLAVFFLAISMSFTRALLAVFLLVVFISSAVALLAAFLLAILISLGADLPPGFLFLVYISSTVALFAFFLVNFAPSANIFCRFRLGHNRFSNVPITFNNMKFYTRHNCTYSPIKHQ